MYVNHPNITLPDDNDTIVWKYLDLSKFLDMLLSQQLFMSRSDKFEDQYEGTFSEPTFEEIKKKLPLIIRSFWITINHIAKK